MSNKKKLVTLLLILTTVFSGCFDIQKPSPKRIEEVRPNPPTFKSISLSIQRHDLKELLSRRGDNSIRLVPVFTTPTASESYVYRLFDVKPRGVYALLGLQNSDLVMAVDGFLIKRPEQFVAYTELLQNEDSSTIEVQRNGEAILLRLNFVPAVHPRH